MEQLRKMLVEYNSHSIELKYRHSWSLQFCKGKFPYYWELVFGILKTHNREKCILEIGCGQGDITSILCYLGFKNIKAYEQDKNMALIAINKLSSLFNMNNVIISHHFPLNQEISDILILVNCVYAEEAKTKNEYKQKLKSFYNKAGDPSLFLLEVIDSSYRIPDNEFPDFIRLDKDDIMDMFPSTVINSWETYTYPANKRTKRLYCIEKK